MSYNVYIHYRLILRRIFGFVYRGLYLGAYIQDFMICFDLPSLIILPGRFCLRFVSQSVY